MEEPSTRIAVALKESVQSIHKTDNRPFVLGTFLKEVRIMGEQRSFPDIVDLLGVAFVEVGPEVKPTLVVELALGNLIDFFQIEIIPAISWELKTRFALQIASALQVLHSKGIVHADVKAQNVLVLPHEKTQFCAKLSDFGNSTVLGAKYPIAAGTQYYLAPECLSLEGGGTGPQAQKYGNSEYRDIYAFGLLTWELATNCQRLPFCDVTLEKVVQMKFSGQGEAATYLLAQVPEDTPQYIKVGISDMLRADPTQRPPLSVPAAQLQKGIEQV
jgi:serine/threonine protein kinase